MASSLIATQTTLFLRHSTATVNPLLHTAALSLTSAHIHLRPLCSSSPISKQSKSKISASTSPTIDISPVQSTQPLNPDKNYLSGSTRTVTTIFAIAIAATKFFAHRILSLAVQLKEPLLSAAGPAFFAAMKGVPTGSLNTPFTVVAAGMAKWLDLYSGVLMVRVLLSWFPNIPWDRQPLSAIRDLCDPYLNLFRNIIPPIFDTLDVSPLLAFAVLGMLGSILDSTTQAS
ncbi:YlmG protein 1-1, chloroplastic [Castilleja foliolosa]|uniref:YlmG protein 1-1, chloroplastic n=1 Tax=Castilleja foliolosa TaxID=1961234 RepID=A0ABD3E4G6_9LAMI